ncbi:MULTISPECIES: transporter substrate-binding domain-containing protein [Dickeya]|uniref:Lysine-arginine-ornithine-binding periplasmic protein (TC 3.A.1.3.1) n=1 Tax=Dickeya aquatica TaxID=1401087 RepID=A0A375A8K2_9GAMM|nr:MULTISPECIES: transporter substrate-binding domain-containing protein [Dickeya]SLM62394.1 Lysine-arginine-ornithine-binding periplasmic protein precursor (TC 3.A.1.3.1) [Dickeya aquatica]
MKKISLLMLSLGLLSSAAALAQTELRFGVEAEYPPFESKNAKGQLEGFDIDLGNAICKAGNFKCSWSEASFDALIPALQAKKFDAINSAMNITEKRKQAIDFTQPIYRIPTQLVGKPNSGLAPTAEALKGKNIGVLQGSIQEVYAKAHWESQGVTVTSYKDQNLVYDDLAAGRLDATLVMAAAGQSGFLDKPEGKGFAFIGGAVDDAAILGSGIGFGLRKGDSTLKTELDSAIKKVKEDGTLDTLAKKYFPGFDVRVQ